MTATPALEQQIDAAIDAVLSADILSVAWEKKEDHASQESLFFTLTISRRAAEALHRSVSRHESTAGTPYEAVRAAFASIADAVYGVSNMFSYFDVKQEKSR